MCDVDEDPTKPIAAEMRETTKNAIDKLNILDPFNLLLLVLSPPNLS